MAAAHTIESLLDQAPPKVAAVPTDKPARVPSTANGGAPESFAERLATHRKAQSSAELTPELLRSFIDATPDAVLIYDGVGRLRWASQSLKHLFGWDPEKVVGQPFYLTASNGTSAVESPWKRWCSVTTPTWIQRGQAARQDGRISWVEEAVTMVRDSAGEISAAVVSARDITAQVKAMESLVESEAFFRSLAEYAADITYQCDIKGVLTWVSDGAGEALGSRPESLPGSPMHRWLDPADQPRWEQALSSARHGQPTQVKVRVRQADGARRWWSISVNPQTNTDSEVTAIAGGWRDIDAHVRREDALVQSEDLFYAVAEGAGDLTVQVGHDSRIAWVSGAARSLLGYQPHDLIGSRLAEFLEPDGDLGIEGIWERGERASFAAWVVTSTGDKKPVHVVCQPTTTTDSVSWVVNAHLLDTEEQRASVVTPPAIRATMRLRGGVVQWVSPTVTSLLGWTGADWMGSELLTFVHTADQAAVRSIIADDGPDRSPSVRCRVQDFNGEYHHMVLTTSRMRRGDGRDTQVVAFLSPRQSDGEESQE